MEAEDNRNRDLDREKAVEIIGWMSTQLIREGEWVSRRIMVAFREVGNKKEEQVWVGAGLGTNLLWYIFCLTWHQEIANT